jgi:hypothetical protein
MPSADVSAEAEQMPNWIEFDPPGSLPHFMNSQQLIFFMFLLLSNVPKFDPLNSAGIFLKLAVF